MKLNRRRLIGGACAAAGAAAVGGAGVSGAEPADRAGDYWFGYCLNTGTIRGQKLGLVQ